MRYLALVLCLATLVVAKPNPKHTIDWVHFWDLAEIQEYLEYLAASYPNIATLETIGTSAEGRAINAIRISYGNQANRPMVIIDGGLRAREWTSTMVAMFVIHEFIEHPDHFTDILDEINFLVIPVANPDGYAFSHTTTRMWVKSRRAVGNGCFGVDLNRNFGYQWSSAGASDPCADNYAGTAAFSEPETQALRSAIERNSANLKLYLSIQAAEKMVLYPFSYNGLRSPANVDAHRAVAEMVAREMIAQNGYLYTYGPAGALLQAETGTVTDYVAGTQGVQYAFVLETRGGAQNIYDMPAAQLEEVLYETAMDLKVMGEYVAGIRRV